MFGKKREVKKSQKSDDPFGFDLMGNFDPTNVDNDDDDDLEAELRQLMISDDNTRPERPARRAPAVPINLNITDDVGGGLDEDGSGDDDDPELLSELNAMMGGDGSLEAEDKSEENSPAQESAPDVNQEETIKLLNERLELYKLAEAKANNENDKSKARRYNRGVKTLQEMLHDTKAGKTVDSADIPPPLPRSATQVTEKSADSAQHNVKTSTDIQDVPSENSETPVLEPQTLTDVPVSVDEEKLEMLKKRQREYRIAALAWKKSRNMEEAVKYVKIAKQFDVVIAALTLGQPIDLSDMPPTPQLPEITAFDGSPATNGSEKVEAETQETTENPEPLPEPPAPVTGDGIGGALKERLEVYRRIKTTAEEEGNPSKARRYGRICKQYEDAIKLYTRGKSIPVDELPVPPGFPPIVDDTPSTSTRAPPPAKPSLQPSPVADNLGDQQPSPPPRKPKESTGILSRAEKQTILLQKRQAELKRAALIAKKDGDLELARNYLRQSKGMDRLISASNAGLPVDMTSIPISPYAKAQLSSAVDDNSNDSFALISSSDCEPGDATGTDAEIYDNLETQLKKQKNVCLSTRDHCKALGDVPGYNRWERMALGYSRDLDMLRIRKRDDLPPPQHHYEQKTYAIVQSCTDLTDNDMEISIIRGVNYPKEADTYVIYEFPYPSDRSPSERTSTIKNTCNPEYEAVFTLTGSVDRSSRQCQRAFKRHALKCQIWSKGGFLRSDSLIGTVTIKLQPLETQCILHDSFPLMNGRKPTGGKLEVKMRLRNPIITKQIEKKTDRWLVIDN